WGGGGAGGGGGGRWGWAGPAGVTLAAGWTGAIAGRGPAALAQAPPLPLNPLNDVVAALRACWTPPPIDQSRAGMQITVQMSFRRNGELFGQPRITFESGGASDDERLAYRIAVAKMLKR